MREQIVICPSPGSFYLVPGDNMYFTERLSWVLLKNLEGLAVNGFRFSQTESTDISTALDTADTFITDFDAWMSQSVQAAAAGNDGALVPFDSTVLRAIVTAIAAAFSGGSALVAILAEIGIRLVVKWIENQFTSHASDQVSRTLIHLFEHSSSGYTLADLVQMAFTRNDGQDSTLEYLLTSEDSPFATIFRTFGVDIGAGGEQFSMLERILNEVNIQFEPRSGRFVVSFNNLFEE